MKTYQEFLTEADIYSGALDTARKLASKAKDGNMKFEGKKYTLTFDQQHWYYVVEEDGEFLININEKTLAKAKKYLLYWLTN
ncbi:MAG: hypothetical protein WC679_02185 [Bacteroidales bacterium]|jgi:hypothetical protein